MVSRAFQTATANLTSNLVVSGTVSMGSSFIRNRIINGAMDIWQRGTSFTPGNQYTADRWYCNRSGGVSGVTFSQSYGAFGSNKNWMSIHRTNGNTSTASAVVYQPIEGINSRDLAGKTVTFSFTVCTGSTLSSTTNNIGIELVYQTTTTDIGLGGSWSSVGSTSVSVPSNTGPTRYSATFTVPSNSTQLLPYLTFSFSGTAGADDRYYITEIQFEEGSVATPFERRSYGQELALCQRYFYSSVSINFGYSNMRVITNGTFDGTSPKFIPFPVLMRIAPTVTTYPDANRTNADNIKVNGSINVSKSNITLAIGPSGIENWNNGALVNVGDYYGFYFEATAEL